LESIVFTIRERIFIAYGPVMEGRAHLSCRISLVVAGIRKTHPWRRLKTQANAMVKLCLISHTETI